MTIHTFDEIQAIVADALAAYPDIGVTYTPHRINLHAKVDDDSQVTLHHTRNARRVASGLQKHLFRASSHSFEDSTELGCVYYHAPYKPKEIAATLLEWFPSLPKHCTARPTFPLILELKHFKEEPLLAEISEAFETYAGDPACINIYSQVGDLRQPELGLRMMLTGHPFNSLQADVSFQVIPTKEEFLQAVAGRFRLSSAYRRRAMPEPEDLSATWFRRTPYENLSSAAIARYSSSRYGDASSECPGPPDLAQADYIIQCYKAMYPHSWAQVKTYEERVTVSIYDHYPYIHSTQKECLMRLFRLRKNHPAFSGLSGTNQTWTIDGELVHPSLRGLCVGLLEKYPSTHPTVLVADSHFDHLHHPTKSRTLPHAELTKEQFITAALAIRATQ
jgi:hypothetical protein